MKTAADRLHYKKPGRNILDQKAWMRAVRVICNGYCLIFLVAACASPAAKLPPAPPKYVYHAEDSMKTKSANSLWSDAGNLFEDRKAKRVNDLVTINILESLSGSGKADTDTSRDSSIDLDVTDFLGMNLDFNIHNAWLLKNLYKGKDVFKPTVKASSKSDFKGAGDTNREGELIATITARVVAVMPNDNLVLESRKEITINQEKQILVLTGVIRPDDISSANTVDSNKIADAKLYYVGDGVIQDKQSPGWLVRALDNVWPF